MTVLKIVNLSMSFGGLKSLINLNLSLKKGEIYGLIGPNGAGKTTVFNLITGVYKPISGEIWLNEKVNLGSCSIDQICRLGMARTFQNIRLFKNMTVLENLLVAIDSSTKMIRPHWIEVLFPTKRFLELETKKNKQLLKLAEFFGLDSKLSDLAGELPYGYQRMLEMARAVATGAEILLLDEPAAGMNPSETHRLRDLLKKIRDQLGCTLLLIEHDMKLVMGVSDRVGVLEFGQLIAEGIPSEIQKNPRVIQAYLGSSRE